MEFASCSILRPQSFSTIFHDTNSHLFTLPKNHLNLASPFSPTFPKHSTFPGKCLHFHRFTAFSSLSGADDQNPSQDLAVLLEVDGVVLFHAEFIFAKAGYQHPYLRQNTLVLYALRSAVHAFRREEELHFYRSSKRKRERFDQDKGGYGDLALTDRWQRWPRYCVQRYANRWKNRCSEKI